jgi:hypothetical protein
VKTSTLTNRFGKPVTATVGSAISFKLDVEQQGIVKEIVYGGWDGQTVQVIVDVAEGGHAPTKNHRVDLGDCWS